MAKPIDFYFDFSSPYAYFASTRIEALAARYGRAVTWHPVLLGVVFKTTGCAPLPMVPLKGEYAMHDLERTARFHRIDYRKPSVFPLSTQLAARAMLWLQQQHGEAKAVEFCQAVLRAYFVDDVDISQPHAIAQIAARLDIDGEQLLAAGNNPLIKEALKTQIEVAMARGVFGAPFIIVDDEPFWGFDHFDQLEAFLKNGKI